MKTKLPTAKIIREFMAGKSIFEITTDLHAPKKSFWECEVRIEAVIRRKMIRQQKASKR